MRKPFLSKFITASSARRSGRYRPRKKAPGELCSRCCTGSHNPRDSHLSPDRLRLGLDVRAWVFILGHSSIKWSVVAPMVAKAVWRNVRHNASVGEEKELGNEIFPDLDARSSDV